MSGTHCQSGSMIIPVAHKMQLRSALQPLHWLGHVNVEAPTSGSPVAGKHTLKLFKQG